MAGYNRLDHAAKQEDAPSKVNVNKDLRFQVHYENEEKQQQVRTRTSASWKVRAFWKVQAFTTLRLPSALKRRAGVRKCAQDAHSARSNAKTCPRLRGQNIQYTACPSRVMTLLRGSTDPPRLDAA